MKKVSQVSELRAKRTDYDIPTFGFKSALLILIGAITGTIILPIVLSLFGVSQNLGILIGNTVITSFTISYSRFFIESKKGFCKGFWISYLLFSLALGFISYFWRYIGLYI
ncbi:hypothetical protein R0131_07535 [Clostridium sp. AL.422]|uniref:hypothetical protein n=1 Tax=Clostridium TaxID=1485 RepID=UPI00293DA624|nr:MULTISPECIES: hypothetical protein [unclassified Clostridium]MDV4150686.1 hypothetical protein [Clostridium sp. AL.422]